MRIRLIHGFTQTVDSWNPVEARLPRDWDVQALEVPDGLDFVAPSEAIGHRGGGTGTWVGYSMGARVALVDDLGVDDLVVAAASRFATGASA